MNDVQYQAILIPRLHDTTGCHTGLTTGLTTVLNEQPLFVQPAVKPGCTTGLTTSLTTGCIHDTGSTVMLTNILGLIP